MPTGTPSPVGFWRRARLAVRLAVLLAVWGAVMVTSWWVLGSERVPTGTVVSGIDIGGLDRQSAINALQDGLKPRLNAQIKVVIGGATSSVTPSDFGLRLDAATTVDNVRTRRLNPFDLPRVFFGGGPAKPVLQIDQAKLSDGSKGLAGEFNQPMREPAITYEGLKPTLVDGVTGRVLDRSGAERAIAAAYLQQTDKVSLPLNTIKPTVSNSAMQATLRNDATKALSEPISITAGGTTVLARPVDIANSLTYSGSNGQMRASIDGTVLHAAIAPGLAKVETPMKNAGFDTSSDAPVVTPSQDGNGVDNVALATAVTEVLAKSGPERRVEVAIGPIPAKITTADAQALGINQKMSTFTQNLSYAPYLVQNIGRAARKIDGTLLKSGATFSLNDTVGERTVANGFTTGLVVGNGGRLQEALGGGVSAVAATLWTVAFFGGLEKVEQGAHLIWISRYQPGLEATVAWGQLDLKVKNNTPNVVLITMKTTKTSVTATLWGTKEYDIKAVSGPKENIKNFDTSVDSSPACVAQSGVRGFDIAVRRVFMKAGKQVKDEAFRTHYIPGPRVTCTGPVKLPS